MASNSLNMNLISDQQIAILADHGVNQTELGMIRDRLEKSGVHVHVVSARKTEVKAWKDDNWGIRIKVDRQISEVNPEDFHGILIPGGVFHADTMRENSKIRDFVKQLFASGRLIGAMGHGIQVLMDAEIVDGRQVTASKSLKTDVVLAGGLWVDEDVVNDNGLITSRYETDLEKFTEIYLDTLRKGITQRTSTVI